MNAPGWERKSEKVFEIHVPSDTAHTLLLMNVAAVLASALRNGEGENVAVALYGGTLTVGGVFFNAVWLHASRGHRLLSDDITPAEAKALARRFLAGPLLYLAGTVIGIFLPIGGIVVFAFLILFYWLPPQRVRAWAGG